MIVGGYLLFGYIKDVPDQLHKKNLESFKNELQKEVEKLRIYESNLHIRKIEKYSQFLDVLNVATQGVKQDKSDTEIKEVLDHTMNEFTKDIMFFAGEGTLKKVVEFRLYSQVLESGGLNEQARFQFIIAELILEMRKDLGYENKNITIDDYMNITVNNWDKIKDEYYERARNAKKIT